MEDKDKYYKEMSEKLYKMYVIKNKDDYLGSIHKYECVINNEYGLFKERLNSQSKDHVMEQVAYEIALILGIKCCKASCRKSNGLYGSFSRYEVLDINNIVPFSDIFNTSELKSDELLDRTIQKTRGVNNFVIELYKYIIFDYILGQQDRHLENISAYKKEGTNILIMYPLYDNGLCCFANYTNDAAIQCLDKGLYSSRMGYSEDIIQSIYEYRDTIFRDDLRRIVAYHKLNKELILKIIDKSDKYNQVSKTRREATANFIMKQAKNIHKLNFRIGEN